MPNPKSVNFWSLVFKAYSAPITAQCPSPYRKRWDPEPCRASPITPPGRHGNHWPAQERLTDASTIVASSLRRRLIPSKRLETGLVSEPRAKLTAFHYRWVSLNTRRIRLCSSTSMRCGPRKKTPPFSSCGAIFRKPLMHWLCRRWQLEFFESWLLLVLAVAATGVAIKLSVPLQILFFTLWIRFGSSSLFFGFYYGTSVLRRYSVAMASRSPELWSNCCVGHGVRVRRCSCSLHGQSFARKRGQLHGFHWAPL